jgi:hypothetical protein
MSESMPLLAAGVGDGVAGLFGFIFLAAIVAGAVWFFVGPAKHADDYVNTLKAQLGNLEDQVLFQQMYMVKGPKNVFVAWLLAAILSPTISYAYRAKWGLAALAFVTLQGFGLWWIASIFSTPLEVMAQNKRLAEQAFTELRVARPDALRRTEPGIRQAAIPTQVAPALETP